MYYDRTYTKDFLRRLREQYPEGTRIELISLYDPCRVDLSFGDQGVITKIDNNANFSVEWDNGCSCDLIYDDDVFIVID